jgi:hypothetical protein
VRSGDDADGDDIDDAEDADDAMPFGFFGGPSIEKPVKNSATVNTATPARAPVKRRPRPHSPA